MPRTNLDDKFILEAARLGAELNNRRVHISYDEQPGFVLGFARPGPDVTHWAVLPSGEVFRHEGGAGKVEYRYTLI